MLGDSSKCGEQIILPTGLDLTANNKSNQTGTEYVSEIPGYVATSEMAVIDGRMQSKLNQLTNFSGAYKKPCNCAKSHCLKLYCECFARGSACDNCNCSNCMNNAFHEEERRRAIKLTLERNPLAFHPKIGEGERKHSKGCNCKRSGCLKNYCECFEAKINCSDLCRCQGCRNFENCCGQKSAQELQTLNLGKNKGSVIHKRMTEYYVLPGLGHSYRDSYVSLPHASQLFGRNQGAESNENSNCYFEEPLIPNGFFSLEVTEAACSCMLAQLEEAKQRSSSPPTQERIVLEEFGRCLEQIIDSASKLQNTAVTSEHMNYVPYDMGTSPDFVTVLPSTGEVSMQVDSAGVGQDPAIFSYLNDLHVSKATGMTQMEPYENKELELLRYSEPLDPTFGAHLYVPQSDKYPIPDSSNVEDLEMVNVIPYQVNPSIGPDSMCQPMMKLVTGTADENMPNISCSTEHYFTNQQKSSDPDQLGLKQLNLSNADHQQSYVTELRSPRMTQLNPIPGVLTSNTSSNIMSHSGSIPMRQPTMSQDGRVLMTMPNHVTAFVGLKQSDDEDEEAHNATAALLSDASCAQPTNRFTELTESSGLSNVTDPFVYRNLSILEATSPTNPADGNHTDSLDLRTTGSHSTSVSMNQLPIAAEQSFQTSLLSEAENYDSVSYTNQTADENASFLKQEMDFFDL
ncbi:Protein lin-54 [Fasciola gigantica]|uniref:Protein lin-54 n=1 Tax=Fasciola gigantica TaxID=46835 RepID=A0A504Z5B5_FASGI|nr:Protein lin-54 [Fasciola gigantica]